MTFTLFFIFFLIGVASFHVVVGGSNFQVGEKIDLWLVYGLIAISAFIASLSVNALLSLVDFLSFLTRTLHPP